MDLPLFKQGTPLLTAEELVAIESIGTTQNREKGHVFIREDDEATDFALLIQKGHVKVVTGRPRRVVAIRGRGEIVGEMAAVDDVERSGDVIAINSVQALHLPGEDWLEFLYEHPRAMHAQWVATSRRLRTATRELAESEFAVERRLAKKLIELVEIQVGEPVERGTLLPFSQPDLASLLGTKKIESVKKILREFKARGMVHTGWQEIIVPDLAPLREIANGKRTAL